MEVKKHMARIAGVHTTIINPQKISGAVSCYFEIETKPDHLSMAIAAARQALDRGQTSCYRKIECHR